MKIPVYEALITTEDEGIFNVSLVDLPAVESNFLAFRELDKVELKFEIQSEEQRLITGVLMRANYNIFREDPKLGPYYIRYSPETIKLMAEKMLYDGTQNSINLMHLEGSNVPGVNLIQLFIKDSDKGLVPKGFENIEDGSLFATYHVENDAVWNEIKNGTFKGFSLEGIFKVELLNFKKTQMNLKSKFLKTLLKFGEVATDKGTIYWAGEEDLKAGDDVFNESYEPLESGEYQTEDQKTIVVVDGKVSEIRDPEAEVAEEEPKAEEFAEEATEEVKEEVIEEPAAPAEEGRNLESEIDELKAQLEELKRAFESIREQLAEPVVEPVAEEFMKAGSKKYGLKAAGIISHLKD